MHAERTLYCCVFVSGKEGLYASARKQRYQVKKVVLIITLLLIVVNNKAHNNAALEKDLVQQKQDCHTATQLHSQSAMQSAQCVEVHLQEACSMTKTAARSEVHNAEGIVLSVGMCCDCSITKTVL